MKIQRGWELVQVLNDPTGIQSQRSDSKCYALSVFDLSIMERLKYIYVISFSFFFEKSVVLKIWSL